MEETKIVRLACPKCKGGIFKQYYVEQPNMISEIGFSNAFHYDVSECVRCGWKSQPFNGDKARIALAEAFEIATMTSDRISNLKRRYPLKFFEEFKELA